MRAGLICGRFLDAEEYRGMGDVSALAMKGGWSLGESGKSETEANET
jgi:hypothetical protein